MAYTSLERDRGFLLLWGRQNWALKLQSVFCYRNRNLWHIHLLLFVISCVCFYFPSFWQALTGKWSYLCHPTLMVLIFISDPVNRHDWEKNSINPLLTSWYYEEWMFISLIWLLLMILDFMRTGCHQVVLAQYGAIQGHLTIMKSQWHCLATAKPLWLP